MHDQLIEELYRTRYVNYREALAPIVGSRDEAHAVVQEAFAQALRRSGDLRDTEALAAWVWRIALGIVGELPDDLTILEPDEHPDLAAAVRTLPPKRRLVPFLRYYAGFSYGEIAEALDLREGAVSATLSQGQIALLEQLTDRAPRQ